MPRQPGRESTRKTVESTAGLEVASFILHHEEWLWRRPCVIADCNHRMGPNTNEPGWVHWRSCDEQQLPAFVVKEGEYDANLGIACPHHVAEILGD